MHSSWSEMPCSIRGKNIPPKAFKFDDLTFEKIEENKERKRSLVGESRESYCATPQFALQTSSEELQSLVERLRLAGKASFFVKQLSPISANLAVSFKLQVAKLLTELQQAMWSSREENNVCIFMHSMNMCPLTSMVIVWLTVSLHRKLMIKLVCPLIGQLKFASKQ